MVGPEDAKAFAAYFANESLPFIGLPDPKASVLKLYGQEVNLFKLGRMPAQVLIDKAGVARYVHYGHNMSDIPKNEELLALGDEINRSQADRATTVTLQTQTPRNTRGQPILASWRLGGVIAIRSAKFFLARQTV